MDQTNTILARIEADVALLRKLIGTTSTATSNGKIPVVQDSYSADEAETAKAEIEAAFRAGLIPYDKKRGMKMMVTKATVGWSPVS